MKFTNNSGQTKAVKVAGGHEVLRPQQSKDIEGDFTPDYIAHLKTQGVEASGGEKEAKPKKAPKKTKPKKVQETTGTESDADAPAVVTDEITSDNASAAQGASE